MKQVITLLTIFLLSISVYGQSLSGNEILPIVESQRDALFMQVLDSCGFTFNGDKQKDENSTAYYFEKVTNAGLEFVTITVTDKLFSFIYVPVTAKVSNMIKEKLLATNFEYGYSNQNLKYYRVTYKGTKMQLEVKDGGRALTFFSFKK